MPYREYPFLKNNYFHVYNRGNNYERIFFEDINYGFFLRRILKIFNDKISLVSFCLMPNHYHLLIKINEDNYLDKAIHKFSISYTKAINKKYNRIGHLFQGRYKAKLVPESYYLLHLSRYLHLNPVRANLVAKPEDWKYSSYLDYLNKRKKDYLETDLILSQVADYEKFVKDFQENQNYFIKDLLF